MVNMLSFTIKEAEHQKIDAFKLSCWRRLLRVPWTARKFKLVNPKGNQPWEYSLEKILVLGKTKDNRRRVWQRMRWLDGITD